MTIGIIDYGAGNIKSVTNALDRIFTNTLPPDKRDQGGFYFISDNPEKLQTADKIIFPGVGHATSAIRKLQEKGLDKFLQETKKPVLGICLGMQLLYEFSEEGNTKCLGIIPGKIQKFNFKNSSDADLSRRQEIPKIPHMGWTQTTQKKPEILDTIQTSSPSGRGWERGRNHFYFVHSYYAPINQYTQEISQHGNQDFTASVKKDNFTGTQYHPEKSGGIGQKVLENFCKQ